VSVADGSRRQTALDQVVVYRLNIERADCGQISGAERGADVSAKQAFVAAVTFLPQTRFRRGLKPTIKIIVEGGLGTLYLAAEVAITQHLIKVGLGMPGGAMDHAAVVAPFAGFAVATEEDAHQPAVPTAAYDLPGFSGQTRNPLPEKSGTLLAHRRLAITLLIQGLGGTRTERESVRPAPKACNNEEKSQSHKL